MAVRSCRLLARASLLATSLAGCGISDPRPGAAPAPSPTPFAQGTEDRLPVTTGSPPRLTACLDAAGIGGIPDSRPPDRVRAEPLSSPDLCVGTASFLEGGERWNLVIVQNRRNPSRLLWVVPHDDEAAAFENAVGAVSRHGGTLVAVKTGGTRENGALDPNRVFGAGSNICPQSGRPPLPRYTEEVTRWRDPGAPIVALHTNLRGYTGQPGSVSILRERSSGWRSFRAEGARGASPDDTLVYVTSLHPPAPTLGERGADPGAMEVVRGFVARGVNVGYERVTAGTNDCSLSNHALLTGVPRFLNIEVVDGDAETQRAIVEDAMVILGIAPP